MRSLTGKLLTCLALTAALGFGHSLRQQPALEGPWTVSKRNVAADLEYVTRMRLVFGFQVKALCARNAELVGRFREGAYARDRRAFDADTDAFTDSLLESIQQFDGQNVPEVMQEAHFKVVECHQLCLDSVKALREAYEAHGAERARLLALSEARCKTAQQVGGSGLREFNAVWSRRSVR